MRALLRFGVISACAWMALEGASHAQVSPEAARALLAKVEPAVVCVKVTAQMTMTMEGRESGKEDQENESTGVVVDATGLTAVSLSEIDPSAMYAELMGEDSGDMSVKSDIRDITIHFGDGTEVAGEIAIRDKDLDIAFIKPATPPKTPAPFVDLANSAEAEILDQVLVVQRRGKLSSWSTSASLATVQAVLTKPRKVYVLPSSSWTNSLGGVVVKTDGKIVGMVMLRKMAAAGKGQPEMLMVVLPAKDALAVAKQVQQ